MLTAGRVNDYQLVIPLTLYNSKMKLCADEIDRQQSRWEFYQ